MFCDITFDFPVEKKQPLDLVLLRPDDENVVLTNENFYLFTEKKLNQIKKVKFVGQWNELPFLNNVEEIECKFCNVKVIPSYPKVKVLKCNYNQISYIPQLDNLEYLNCGSNRVECFYDSYPKLKTLICSFNKQLRQLPEMKQIEHLDVNHTKVRIEHDYENIIYLDISFTVYQQLSDFYLVKKMKRLDTRNTRMVDFFPMNVEELFMDNI